MRHPLGLGCLTRESVLASIWFAKNAPHRIINVGGGKIRVGGSCPKYPPQISPVSPRFSPVSPPFFLRFSPFSPVFPRFSPFFPVFPCYWEPNADWVREPWTPGWGASTFCTSIWTPTPPPPLPPSIRSISDISHILLYTLQKKHATPDIRLYTQSCHGPVRTLFFGLILCLVPMIPCETMLYWPSPN